jgi:hypothetical protein
MSKGKFKILLFAVVNADLFEPFVPLSLFREDIWKADGMSDHYFSNATDHLQHNLNQN